MSSGVDGERGLPADGGAVWQCPGRVVRDLGRAGGSGCSW